MKFIEINKLKLKIILVVLIVFIFILSVFLYSNLIDYLSVLEKKEIYASVTVSDSYGFEINGSALMFGMTTPGSSASKSIDLTNDYDSEVRVEIYSKGEIGRFLEISENNFLLGVGESKEVNFAVVIPENIDYRVYDGRVFVLIRNAVIK